MKNIFLKTIFIANGILTFAAHLLGPLWAIFVGKLTNDIFYVSLTASVHMISTSVFLFLISRYGDRVKHKPNLLLFGYISRAWIWVMYAFATDITHVLLLQVALGLHEAVSSPAFDALVAEHLDKGQHIKDYSIWKLIQNFTGAIGALIGAVIVKHYGFDIMFFLMAGLAMLSAVILYMGMMKKNLEVITENECY